MFLKIHSKLLRKFCSKFSNIFANFSKIKNFSIAPLCTPPRSKVWLRPCLMQVCNTNASENAARVMWVDLSILIFLVGALVFAAPVAFFVHLEPDWTVLDALYYVLISMTTIGFGDYIPGTLLLCVLLYAY